MSLVVSPQALAAVHLVRDGRPRERVTGGSAMTDRIMRADGNARFAVHRCIYDLVVVAGDARDLVRSAGAWLCDRALAGWKVLVAVPDGVGIRALRVLGLKTTSMNGLFELLKGSPPAAVAIASGVMAGNPHMGEFIEWALNRKIAEVTICGDRPPAQFAHHFHLARHPASAAALAFKAHAMAATENHCSETFSVEEFYSAALWYRQYATDLMPVSQLRQDRLRSRV